VPQISAALKSESQFSLNLLKRANFFCEIYKFGTAKKIWQPFLPQNAKQAANFGPFLPKKKVVWRLARFRAKFQIRC